MTADAQILAADPGWSVFLTANAGSGKTRTLVDRVARLLLRGARPEAILCVTYTKAAAAEMQRRLFERLGAWAVLPDEPLRAQLAELGEAHAPSLPVARALFARALETPGGLKVQTIHAFCERLLRRFPLEAGVSPRFTVMEDAAAAEVAAAAREAVARRALSGEGAIADAYAHLSVALDFASFEGMFACFDAERDEIAAYLARTAEAEGVVADVWRRCGFPDGPDPADAIEARAVAATNWPSCRRAAAALLRSGSNGDLTLGRELAAIAEAADRAPPSFAELWSLFCTKAGEPRASMATKAVDQAARDWLAAEQNRLGEARRVAKAARVAEDTLAALVIASAYAETYAAAKAARGALDFADLIERTRQLLTERADAAWVLFKLDGGIDHVLVDEAQDTAPEQWDIVRELTAEFFAGAGRRDPCRRTVFAVGDEKQSIYSFQGARPERLLHETQDYERRAREAGCDFRGPALIKSWRSAPEVLRFVDAVFDDPAARSGLQPEREDIVRHETTRENQPGAVDFWPLEREQPREDGDPWRPLDVEQPGSARKQLADRLAREIRALVNRGEGVWEKGRLRPAGYGDVLILVQRRDATFEEIIRALKQADVPVAGADRLRLSEHVAFQDLLALVRFVLFPADDLTLATLLRSPFCDVDEASLFDLAYGRDGRGLWSVLRDRAAERPDWTDALSFLQSARGERGRPPFDFLSRLLERPDAAGRSVRTRLLTRLGGEAQDALNETLAQALAAEARGIFDLEGFAAAMARADVEVKRELEEPRGEVRVMTVHGAKGLEAPIVILPDTCAKPRVDGPALLKTADGAFLWCSSKKADCEPSADARTLREQAKKNESFRLLYVALTRARDRLIVCGRLDKNQSKTGKPAPESWYALTEAALAHPSIAPQVRTIDAGELTLRRYGADPAPAPAATAPVQAPEGVIPEWARRPAAPERRVVFTSPTALAGAGGAAPSPLAVQGGLGRFRRGELIHKLLELLPDLPSGGRAEAAGAFLAKQQELNPEQRAEMAAAALSILSDPAFAAVFGPGSRAEAAVAGQAPGLPPISGRVDRLLVEPGRVLVVDFKTNRPPPTRIEDTDTAYLDQMAVYTAVLRSVFPDRPVEAALLWTDAPRLMPVPHEVIEARLALLRAD